MLLRLRNSFVLRKRLTLTVAGVVDAGRAAWVFTATFRSRLISAFLVWFTVMFLSRLAAAFRLGLTEEFRAVAGVVDDGRAALARVADACPAAAELDDVELVRGFAYDRCC
jgi:hypothetical protein